MQIKKLTTCLRLSLVIDQVISKLPVFNHIFRNSLGEEDNGKRVLIITDLGMPGRRIAPMLAYGYYHASLALGLNPRMVNIGDKIIDDAIEKEIITIPQNSIVILAVSNKLKYGKSKRVEFNKFIKRNNHKKITSTGLKSVKSTYFSHIMNLSNTNFEKMNFWGKIIKNYLDQGKIVHITTDNGTNVKFGIEKRIAISNDGYYKNTNGGNMPAGEVYIAPIENKTNGTVVIDGSIRTLDNTYLIKEPVTLKIKNGIIVDIKGGLGAKLLKEALEIADKRTKNKESVRTIAELGIGINPRAKVNGPTIVNEKTLGTFHVAIGSNTHFGGKNKAPLHMDQVCMNPKIKIDNKTIEIKKK